ncbi:MAG TPA: tRNA epoxyqueuosine(34) reductase QueG [Thermodesulfobacteriota bacterium]|nr:tRNA epoxyqueuosine(34) reductase QueG [Thermodesulfobacteriota bacterium]
MDIREITALIKSRAHQVGFDLVGISPAGSFPENRFYKEWVAKGYAGEMKYMERDPQKREDPGEIVPGARSVITCGLNYNTDYPYSTEAGDSGRGWIARYAWGDDYHELMDERLKTLEEFIASSADGALTRRYVDTGPVLERVYGKYGGIGWTGKNTCLINQRVGSWIFLGEIITTLELEYDGPAPDRCGTCTRCIEACPTGAITEPYVLDSRLCISYLTIELKDGIADGLREKIGNNIFGCDICQDVCPWNRRAFKTGETGFQPREGLYNPALGSFSGLGPDEFSVMFKGSPVKRAKRKGFLRNVLVAMGNSGDKSLIPVIEEYLSDPEPLVREHAEWALRKLGGEGSGNQASERIGAEPGSAAEEADAILSK